MRELSETLEDLSRNMKISVKRTEIGIFSFLKLLTELKKRIYPFHLMKLQCQMFLFSDNMFASVQLYQTNHSSQFMKNDGKTSSYFFEYFVNIFDWNIR